MSAEPGAEPTTAVEQSGPIDAGGALAANARVVSGWTFVSRLTGFLRIAAVGAVLGPTYFGNLFQTSLYVPFVLCELLAATMIPPLLAPRLARLLHARGDAGALANGFLGAMLPLFVAMAIATAAAAPLLLLLITAAVTDPAVRAEQIAIGVPLLIAFAPQIVLAAIIAIAIAVQHAHGRFALSAAGQIVENAGLIAVLIAIAALHGWETDIGEASTGFAVSLGLGVTGVVAVHAAVQWLAAARLGIRLVPRWRWRDAEVRSVLRAAIPAGSATALGSAGWLVMMIASGQVVGGAIAFQLAQSLYYLPIGLIARPIAVVQLPDLALRAQALAEAGFRLAVRHGLRLALFAIIPIAVGLLAFPSVLAGAVAQGRMASPEAIDLVTMALLGLASGLVGDAILVIATSAAYARHEAPLVLRSAAIRFLILGVGLGLGGAFIEPGSAALLGIGLSYGLSSSVAAAYLYLRLQLSERGGGGEWLRWIGRTLGLGLVAVLPSAVVASQHRLAEVLPDAVLALVVVLVAVGLYLLLQRALGSAELRDFIRRAPSIPGGADRRRASPREGTG
jgi:putative peptidoglycan lipid II flippase